MDWWCRAAQERGEEPGAGVVADAARVGVRLHDMDERLPRPRCPWRWGQDPGAPFALREVSHPSSLLVVKPGSQAKLFYIFFEEKSGWRSLNIFIESYIFFFEIFIESYITLAPT